MAIGDLYPNPAVDYFNIDITLASTGTVNFEIVDMMGRTVESFATTMNEGLNHFTLNTKGLNNQVYVVKAINGTEIQTSLLMVKKP
jgi:hypothetical protein